MATGTIKKIMPKGFGFISQESGEDVFFHMSGCENFDALSEGMTVEFDVEKGDKGLKAVNVKAA